MLLRNLCCAILASSLLSPATALAQASHDLSPGSSARTPDDREDQARRARPIERLRPESGNNRRLHESCNQAEAKRQWQDALDAGVVDGARVQNGTLTMVVTRDAWQTYPPNTREQLFEVMNCMIAGPGQKLTEIQAADRNGKVLQSWKFHH